MQQVAMRRVQLYKVKTGIAGIADRLAEIIDDPRDLIELQRTRHGGVDANGVGHVHRAGRYGCPH